MAKEGNREVKWLLRKASGSRKENYAGGDYSNDRNKKSVHGEELPYNEGYKKAHNTVDTTLVKRWLYDKVGQDFNEVYSEFVSRVQPQYRSQYLECIYWYVQPAKLVEMGKDGFAYSLTERYFYKGLSLLPHNRQCRFYVHPRTNILCRITDEQMKKSKEDMHTKWAQYAADRSNRTEL